MRAPIGVLLFETAGERLKGDPGFPGTFAFPILYGRVEGSYRDLIEPGFSPVCDRLVAAAQALERQGAAAIAGDCGLMALYQNELARAVRLPVISSSLVLLPLAERLSGGRVGVITGHSALLGEHHFRAAGAGGREVAIQGMEEAHFRESVIEGHSPQRHDLMARDLISAARKLLDRAPDLSALLLECSNLAAVAPELRRETGLPIWDINLGIRMLRDLTKGPE